MEEEKEVLGDEVKNVAPSIGVSMSACGLDEAEGRATQPLVL